MPDQSYRQPEGQRKPGPPLLALHSFGSAQHRVATSAPFGYIYRVIFDYFCHQLNLRPPSLGRGLTKTGVARLLTGLPLFVRVQILSQPLSKGSSLDLLVVVKLDGIANLKIAKVDQTETTFVTRCYFAHIVFETLERRHITVEHYRTTAK